MARTIFFILVIFVVPDLGKAQVFPVDTLAKPGSLKRMINLVFIGDGYTAADMPAYSQNVVDFTSGIFALSPFTEYKNYFNVFAVNVVSNESGVKHPQNTSDSDCAGVPVSNADNYFGCTFDTNGIHRLLAPTNYTKAFNVLNANLPSYDQAFIIVNTPYYGGSGGTFATASTNFAAAEVAVHEIGHSFAQLSDEYWVGPGYAVEKANMTKETDPAKVKWKKWIGKEGVGTYSYSEDPTWFRPHQNCKMRFLNVPFCAVCREAFIERIHDLVNPVLSYAPLVTTLPVEETDFEFSITTIDPIPNTLRTLWKQDDVVVARNTATLSIPVSGISSTTVIKAEVSDTTGLSKSPTHNANHVRVVTWTLQKGEVVTGTASAPQESYYKLSVAPNPVAGRVDVSYALTTDGMVTLKLLDASGRRVKAIVNEKQKAGTYTYEFTAGELNMSGAGVYFLSLTVNGTSLSERIIKL